MIKFTWTSSLAATICYNLQLQCKLLSPCPGHILQSGWMAGGLDGKRSEINVAMFMSFIIVLLLPLSVHPSLLCHRPSSAAAPDKESFMKYYSRERDSRRPPGQVQEMSIQKGCLSHHESFRDNWPIHFNSNKICRVSHFHHFPGPFLNGPTRGERESGMKTFPRTCSFCEKTFVIGMSV